MIFSENPKPPLNKFQKLMNETDEFLNAEAKTNEEYFRKRTAQLLEEDIFYALTECAKGTEFENTIELVSGLQFPDIQIHNFYGVEVKSTIKNHWTSTGSSILESTRNTNIRRIYMTFGKLWKPVEFRSRPYEECLSDIAVTHYPRYKIDMELEKGQSIFDKIGMSYDEFRKLENPVDSVSKYYKARLKPGESLWWASDAQIEEQIVPLTVKIFSSLEHKEQEQLKARLYALFPEILGNSPDKYNEPALFMITQYGIVNPSFRDMFSAGGQTEFHSKCGIPVKMPAAFGRIEKYKYLIFKAIEESSAQILHENWKEHIKQDRISQWCDLCAKYYANGDTEKYKTALLVLCEIFSNVQL